MKGPFEVGLEPKQDKNPGSVGGAGSSATPGGYNQGLQFAAEGGFSFSKAKSQGGMGNATQMDLRKGNAAGSTNAGLAAKGGYNQGLQFAAEGGFTASQALSEINARPMGRASETGGKHSAKEASGYNQGTMFAGKTGK